MTSIGPTGRLDTNENLAGTGGARAKGVMETFNDHWWRDNYSTLDGLQADRGYEHYEPGFRYGWDSAGRHRGRRFEDVEPELERDWTSAQRDRAWGEHRGAIRHAFERAMHVFEGAPDPDERR